MMEASAFIQALRCTNKQSTPIWLMRQAGRYMPQYRLLKLRYSLIEMFHNAELIQQVTLMPIEQLSVDAAILFSDILMVLNSFNKKWHFEEKKGPIIEDPIHSLMDIEQLSTSGNEVMYEFITSAIFALKKQLKIPLIGFCGAPFTIASYLIEGCSAREAKKTKQLMYQESAHFHLLLDKIADAAATLLNVQIKAGVDVIQIFDSWADTLPIEEFCTFSIPYIRKIIQRLHSPVPVIIFCRGSSLFASEIAKIHPQAISIDWQADLTSVRKQIPKSIALQGNLDPVVLLAHKEVIKKKALGILSQMHQDPSYIFNLGHGILPETPFENVKYLVDCVKEYNS